MQTKNKENHFDTNDKIIREALRGRLYNEYKDSSTYRIVDEMSLHHGSVRADLAVINGVMHAFEIKSDRDNLLRLTSQTEAYNAIFDKVTIVVGFTHVFEVLENIPDWWGVEIAKINNDSDLVFSTIRAPRNNPNKDKLSIASLLWRHEVVKLLEEKGAIRGMRSKPRYVLHKQLAQTLDMNALSRSVRTILCSRVDWLVA